MDPHFHTPTEMFSLPLLNFHLLGHIAHSLNKYLLRKYVPGGRATKVRHSPSQATGVQADKKAIPNKIV